MVVDGLIAKEKLIARNEKRELLEQSSWLTWESLGHRPQVKQLILDMSRKHGSPLQYSRLENPMGRGGWRVIFHRMAKHQTWLKWPSMHAWIHEPWYQKERQICVQRNTIIFWGNGIKIPIVSQLGSLFKPLRWTRTLGRNKKHFKIKITRDQEERPEN